MARNWNIPFYFFHCPRPHILIIISSAIVNLLITIIHRHYSVFTAVSSKPALFVKCYWRRNLTWGTSQKYNWGVLFSFLRLLDSFDYTQNVLLTPNTSPFMTIIIITHDILTNTWTPWRCYWSTYNTALYIEYLRHGPPCLPWWINNDEINMWILTLFCPPLDKAHCWLRQDPLQMPKNKNEMQTECSLSEWRCWERAV